MTLRRKWRADGTSVNEYDYFVDLSPYPTDLDGLKPCYHIQLATYMPTSEIGDFGGGMNLRRLFIAFAPDMRMLKAASDGTQKAWWTFTPRFAPSGGKAPFTMYEAERSLNDLLAYLDSRPLPIIWKEDEHGYQIDKAGRIKRKWKLEPF